MLYYAWIDSQPPQRSATSCFQSDRQCKGAKCSRKCFGLWRERQRCIMAATAIALQRLYQQRLAQNPLATPGEVVAWLGAVQAKDYLGAKWALGLRMQQATHDAVER